MSYYAVSVRLVKSQVQVRGRERVEGRQPNEWREKLAVFTFAQWLDVVGQDGTWNNVPFERLCAELDRQGHMDGFGYD